MPRCLAGRKGAGEGSHVPRTHPISRPGSNAREPRAWFLLCRDGPQGQAQQSVRQARLRGSRTATGTATRSEQDRTGPTDGVPGSHVTSVNSTTANDSGLCEPDWWSRGRRFGSCQPRQWQTSVQGRFRRDPERPLSAYWNRLTTIRLSLPASWPPTPVGSGTRLVPAVYGEVRGTPQLWS